MGETREATAQDPVLKAPLFSCNPDPSRARRSAGIFEPCLSAHNFPLHAPSQHGKYARIALVTQGDRPAVNTRLARHPSLAAFESLRQTDVHCPDRSLEMSENGLCDCYVCATRITCQQRGYKRHRRDCGAVQGTVMSVRRSRARCAIEINYDTDPWRSGLCSEGPETIKGKVGEGERGYWEASREQPQ